ncbi:MAG: PIG-L family deacetylase [Anaerolineaceae bacterium]|nr:PIG-L family deacetylase [Anaerolineaceae bacterium]
MAFNEHWDGKQVILIILAHPDDPEFFCGATIARWTEAGHDVHYLIFTKGDKGSNDPEMTPDKLMQVRVEEQRAAADVLKVKTVEYLEKMDGYIEADLETRKEIVQYIRKIKPQIVLTCDPANTFSRDGYINHPDHRSVGQQVIDAIFPATGNQLFFPELYNKGLKAHTVKELWLSIPQDANTVIDVTKTWPLKLMALEKHISQIGNGIDMKKRMNKRYVIEGGVHKPRYEEKFKRIVLR